MKIRGIEITYDRTNIDDVDRFETALERYSTRAEEIRQADYTRQSERLADGCKAAEELLRTAFSVDVIEATGVNARSLGALTDLVMEITEAILMDNKAQAERYRRIASKYGNLRQ